MCMTPTVAVSLIVIADSRVEGEESLGDGAHDSTEIYEELKRLGKLMIEENLFLWMAKIF